MIINQTVSKGRHIIPCTGLEDSLRRRVAPYSQASWYSSTTAGGSVPYASKANSRMTALLTRCLPWRGYNLRFEEGSLS